MIAILFEIYQLGFLFCSILLQNVLMVELTKKNIRILANN